MDDLSVFFVEIFKGFNIIENYEDHLQWVLNTGAFFYNHCRYLMVFLIIKNMTREWNAIGSVADDDKSFTLRARQ